MSHPFTKALHDAVQPRSHLLLEPDEELYTPYLKPLLKEQNVKLIPKSGIVWHELQEVLTPEHLPNQIEFDRLDLDKDPDRELLHPQELAVAAKLRLSCAQYLTNKRKIFRARLQTLKDGKNFTKTAAQGACAIDVNKASQLWDAFNRVGWFDEKWYAAHL